MVMTSIWGCLAALGINEGERAHLLDSPTNAATTSGVRCSSFIRMVATSLGLAATLTGQAANAADVTITVDAANQVSGNPHFWSTCVGTGTASLTLRPDLQTHYQLANRELGMQRVRGHGVLNDAMGIYQGSDKYDFTKYDKYLDAIAAAKMRPMIELSFMPTALATAGNNKNPPKDYATYQKFIAAVVKHTVDKFGAEDVGKWYWEVWNEPNYEGFWTGTMDDYLKLYDAAVAGATSALPSILIGGPVTTGGSVSQMTTFINHVKSKNVRFSFLSSHGYPGGEAPSADANFGIKDNNDRVKVITTAGYTTDQIPSINTEWNTSYTGQGGSSSPTSVSMDSHVNAAFILKSVKLLTDQVQGDKPPLEIFSYWVISDVFDESGGAPLESYILGRTPDGTLPFGQVFGMMTFQGMRKAAFNGFKMLNYTGNKRLQVLGGTGSKDGVDGMATVSADGSQLQIIVYNHYATIAQTGSDNVTVTVNNLPFAGKEAYVARFAIDETHSNPYSVWLGQNKPTKPDEKQWQAMRKAQHLMPVEPVAKKIMEATYTATFAVPKQGSAMIVIGLNRPLTGRDAKVEIEGEDYDGQSGVTKEESGDNTMGQSISVNANGWIYFENVDYTDQGVDNVDLRVKSAADTSVELRSESDTGTLLGKCALKSTSNAWATQTCKLSAPATGVSKLYVLFAGAAHLNWLKFAGAGNPGAGGSGGGSGNPDGGVAGSTGTGGSGGGGKGGTGDGAAGSSGSGSAGKGGSVSSGGVGTGVSANGGSGGASTGSGGSSSSGGASQVSSGGAGSGRNSGESSASSSSSGSGRSGGSSGQSSARSSGSPPDASGGPSGCGCRMGGAGLGPRGAFAMLGLLLAVLTLRRQRVDRRDRPGRLLSF